jgi:hypothetical protein
MTKTLLLAVSLAAALWTAPAPAVDDPTRPFDGAPRVRSAPVPSGPVLQATRVSSVQKLAVISGRTVSVGDTVDGAVVTDIRPYEVVLEKNGRETTLRMIPRLEKEQR